MNRQELQKQLEALQVNGDRALSGLTADRHLMLKIEKAARQPEAGKMPRRRVWAPVLAVAAVLALAVSVTVPALNRGGERQLISTQAAGGTPNGNLRATMDVQRDNISISRNGATPGYRSLWEETGATFPLIGVKGRYYRMMTSPVSVDSSLLGDCLGTVEEYTTEPSLSGTDVLLSNAASFGTEVYEIDGMGGTLLAAKVGEDMRLFQRVGFNSSALRGSETLADTLQISGHIIAMELSDVGVISDAATCETLFATLIDNASYESSGMVNGTQNLLIELDNGLTVQLAVRDDRLAACGTWSCPEFLEAFEAAAQ